MAGLLLLPWPRRSSEGRPLASDPCRLPLASSLKKAPLSLVSQLSLESKPPPIHQRQYGSCSATHPSEVCRQRAPRLCFFSPFNSCHYSAVLNSLVSTHLRGNWQALNICHFHFCLRNTLLRSRYDCSLPQDSNAPSTLRHPRDRLPSTIISFLSGDSIFQSPPLTRVAFEDATKQPISTTRINTTSSHLYTHFQHVWQAQPVSRGDP